MKCRVRLERLRSDESTTALQPGTLTSQLLPARFDAASQSSPPSLKVNKIKESKARPLSKIKSIKTSTMPLAKVSSVTSCQQKKQMADWLSILRSCKNCKVLLVDCWKNKALPPYITSPCNDITHETEFIEATKRLKKKKKEKHKDEKVAVNFLKAVF